MRLNLVLHAGQFSNNGGDRRILGSLQTSSIGKNEGEICVVVFKMDLKFSLSFKRVSYFNAKIAPYHTGILAVVLHTEEKKSLVHIV